MTWFDHILLSPYGHEIAWTVMGVGLVAGVYAMAMSGAMTPAQRKQGFVRPEPVGTLAEQDAWYRRLALQNTLDRLAKALSEPEPEQKKEND